MLTRFVCDLALDGAERDLRRLKAAAGPRWWRETTADQLSDTCRALREASVRWRDLRAGEALKVCWRLSPMHDAGSQRAARRGGVRLRA